MKERNTILGLSAAHLITDLYTPVIPAILPLLILENGYPYFLAGLIITVYQLTSSFLQPVIGWLFDRKGTAVHISYSVGISALFISLIGIMHNYYLILICAAMGALGHAFFHPGALGTVSRLTRDGTRGRLTSYFVVGGNLGFAIGPILAGLMVGYYGLPGITLLIIPGLFMAIVLQRILPKPDYISINRSGTDAGTGILKRNEVFALAILVFASALRSWAIFASVTYLPTFLAEQGFDVITANFAVSGMLFAGVLGQVVGGTISDSYGRKEYTLIGLLASIPPLFGFLLGSGPLAILSLLLFGFCLWSTFSVTVAMAHEIMPSNVGLVSGLVLGFAVGAGGLGVAAMGFLADLFTLKMALTLLIIPILGSIVLFALLPYPWKRVWNMMRMG